MRLPAVHGCRRSGRSGYRNDPRVAGGSPYRHRQGRPTVCRPQNIELDRFLNRRRKLYPCQQLNEDISELFNLADQALFSSLQKNSHHILQRLLPAKSTQPCNFRPRRHIYSLTQKQSSYDNCNFVTCMLFYHIYWLNYFLAGPLISLFHCAACHTLLLNEYIQGGPKKLSHIVCPYLRQIMSDFQIFFHRHILWKICNKLVITYTATP